jgi:putative hemolysin
MDALNFDQLFNLRPGAALHQKHVTKTFRRQHYLYLTALVILFLLCTLIVYTFLEWRQNRKVLGVTQTDSASTQITSDPAALHCQSSGGEVVITTTDTGEAESWCALLDNVLCDLNTFYVTGRCQLPTTPTPIPTPSPTSPPTPSPAPNQARTYRIIMAKKVNGSDPIEPLLKDYLTEALQLKNLNHTVITSIYFDTREGSPYETDRRYNFSYYLVVYGSPLRAGQIVEDYATQIKIESTSGLDDYFKSPQYCQTTDDCLIRRNLCQYGAFNPFQPYIDSYSCVSMTDHFGHNRLFYDSSQSCKAERFYEGVSCDNNLCRPLREAGRCLKAE